MALKRQYKTILGLLSNAERWIKHSSATTQKRGGQYVDPQDSQAACFCLTGAVTRVYGWGPAAEGVRDRLAKTIKRMFGVDGIVVFNDAKWRKHSDILAVLKKAKV